MKTQKGNISKSMIIEGTIDQTECIENTQPDLSRDFTPVLSITEEEKHSIDKNNLNLRRKKWTLN
jgi:hypothetical protein